MPVPSLVYHSTTCVCDKCLLADSRLQFITTNSFMTEVIFLDAKDGN